MYEPGSSHRATRQGALVTLYLGLRHCAKACAAAVAEKVGSLRAADDFLRERAGSAKPKDMLKYLRRAPKVAPSGACT